MIHSISKLFFLGALIKTAVIHGSPLPNFQENISSFILEEKQIIIPGYPTAFNPSVIRWENGKLLLSFRARDPLTHSANLMGFVWLDDNFEVASIPTLLNIYGAHPLKTSRAQDPRLIQLGNHFYIAYNNILNDTDLETRRMLTAELHFKDEKFYIYSPIYILSFQGDKKNWIEKNWSPFDYQDHLHFSYSLNPHRVFKLSDNQDSCETVSISTANTKWAWGELRGGTPSLLDGDEYLGFFHSVLDMKSLQSNGQKISHYFMGAYRFKASYPFSLSHISPEPIIGSTFYTNDNYPTWKPLRVIFPGGLVFNNDSVCVVYGRQDHECWVVKLDKQSLMNSLIRISND